MEVLVALAMLDLNHFNNATGVFGQQYTYCAYPSD